MRTRGIRFALRSLGLVLCSAAYASPPEAQFMGLGDLPGSPFISVANGVSGDGTAAVGRGQPGSFSHGFRWTEELGLEDVGVLPGHEFSFTRAANQDGSVVVGGSLSLGGETEAFMWSAGSIGGLGHLTGGNSTSQATAINADGTVIVGGASSGAHGGEDEAFLWTSGGGMMPLGDLDGGATSSEATAVSADGSVVAGTGSSESGMEAFRYTGGSMAGLGDLGGGTSWARGMDATGATIVGGSESANGTEAFVWTQGEMTGLGDLADGDFASDAYAVSADGSVVVGEGTSPLGTEAFIWDAVHGMRNLKNVLEDELGLDLTGWFLSRATGISDDGMTIVGNGRNAQLQEEAWIAVIPEPSTGLLTLTALALLAHTRRSR